MSDLLTADELAGLRQDFDELLGKSRIDGVDDEAQTTVQITRTSDSDRGELNDETLQYDTPTPTMVYEGPFTIGPVIYRRDRQEDAGGTSQRIRQYRGKGPWDMPRVELDDVLTVLTSSDPEMPGLTLTVIDVIYEDGMSIRRITLVDTSSNSGTGNC